MNTSGIVKAVQRYLTVKALHHERLLREGQEAKMAATRRQVVAEMVANVKAAFPELTIMKDGAPCGTVWVGEKDGSISVRTECDDEVTAKRVVAAMLNALAEAR